jgi:fatty acid desaturase
MSGSTSDKFTKKEIIKHNNRGDVWVIIRNKVYDLTEFQYKHPGGFVNIRLVAGKDATQLFESYHSMKIINSKILDRYLIGDCIDSDGFPMMSEFYITLKNRIDEYMKMMNTQKSLNDFKIQGIRFVMIITMVIYAHINCLYAPTNLLNFMIWTLISGLSNALCGLHLMHDASHNALGKNMYVWYFVGFLSQDVINGASYYIWIKQHILGHHVYCNVDKFDPDINVIPFRFSEFQKLKSYHKYQYIFAPVLYTFLGFKYIQVTILNILNKRNAVDLKLLLIFGLYLHLMIYIGVPLINGVSSLRIFAYFFVVKQITSLYLVIMFQASHIHDTSYYSDISEAYKTDWAKLQVASSQDYSINSWIVTLLSGGLNYQIEHHLLPNVCQLHYPYIQPIVERTCNEYSIEYTKKKSIFGAIYSNIKQLYKMGLKN